MLNKASHVLIRNPYFDICSNIPSAPDNSNDKNKAAITRFATAPADDIFPFLLFPTGPDIMTAPGAAIMNPRNDMIIANINILSHALNSALHPYFWATILWDSSWAINPTPTDNEDIIKNVMKLNEKIEPPKIIANANEIATHALIKSTSSVLDVEMFPIWT